MGERLGARQKGTKNKSTVERENLNDEKCSLPAASPLRMLEARSGSRLADGTAMTIYTETSDKGFQFTDFRLKDRRAMRSRPAISTRRMIGLTDGHPSFVLQTPSPRPSR